MFDPTIAAFRFGFGLPQPQDAPASVAEMLAGLDGPDAMAQAFPGPRSAEVIPLRLQAEAARRDFRRSRNAPETAEARAAAKTYRLILRRTTSMGMSASKATLARAIASPHGLRERLVWFWANHFTTAAPDRRNLAVPATLIDEAIRPHLTAPFAQMLTAVTLHPAMLDYLDQSRSIGPNSARGTRNGKGLNENLARELLELHTMGVDSGYTQNDVRQLAELLTGLTTGAEGMEFDARRAEPGAEQVLGREYGAEGAPNLAPISAFLADLAHRPETAIFLSRKLARHFLGPRPGERIAPEMAAVWRDTGGNLASVMAAMLTSPQCWQPGAETVRLPAEFLVASCRAIGLKAQQVARMGDGPFQRLFHIPMDQMGQTVTGPPGPDGWPDDPEFWITPQGMTARILWATTVPGRLVQPMPDPAQILDLALGPRASDALRWAIPRAESIRQGVGLILSSPEFNRR